ncbi:hypothetical protein FHS82_003292 [Pseudochelatococcus lubricantis]|uniref:DUF459 domain-containing protein n=1 Tax=Pseudochelatococcus lubricantis TaxID=1538102 RepID=A0ABX0V2S8_9HYPH|nr:DUF459 domain-containing protein [Pseudochelatococcus lubricantis]NIJ59437.1 hypothetical protein [Pseudochelatococcus lubricantis]
MLRIIAAITGVGLVLGAAQAPLHAASDPLTRFLDSIFKKEQQPAQPPAARSVRQKPTRPPAPAQARKVPRKPRPATVIVRDAQQKREANTFIAVIGDSLGEALAGGLQEAFATTREIAVVSRAGAETSLTRATLPDWAFLMRDYSREGMPAPQPITVGVVLLGAEPPRSLMDGEVEVPFESARWKELMSGRIDSLIRTFADRDLPLIWVGLPPMKNEAHSDAASALNALYREEVLKAGGVFVDIWAGFSNDEKEFTANGPDVRGQTAQLRNGDGVGLTKAGGRKAAHFVELEIRRLLQARGLSTVIAATPAETSPQAEADQEGALLSLPDMPVPVVIPVKPAAGPILPLASLQSAPDGQLLTQRPVLKGDAAVLVHRVYGEGRAPEPVAGRADDFSWPPPERPLNASFEASPTPDGTGTTVQTATVSAQ